MAGEENRIRILDDSIARKIAAGEVIERPQAVVRELLDNSLDAGASKISVELSGGGNELIRVLDNGHGMSRDDLSLCVKPHATSKIATDDDLMQIRTLGFRGEALSSIAAVSRLQITSGTNEWTGTIRVEGGNAQEVGQAQPLHGTVVEVADLFYNVPARKRFLKRPQTEGPLCAAVYRDKALGFPSVEFRLTVDGELRSYLPPGSITERIVAAYPEKTEPALLHELSGSGDGFSFRIVAGEPSSHRRDRRQIQLFVNSRRIWEFALTQAIEYAYGDYLHGGLHPVAYLFLQIDPELIDVNIHPAKREIRFRAISEIHRRVVEVLSSFLRVFDVRARSMPDRGYDLPISGTPIGDARRSGSGRAGGAMPGRQHAPGNGSYDLDRTLDPASVVSQKAIPYRGTAPATAGNTAEGQLHGYRYLGQVMGLFLAVELSDRLYLIDQHAAHERILFDRLRDGSDGQELMFPVHLDLDASQQEVIEQNRDDLERLGIGIECSNGVWEMTRSPSSVDIAAEEMAILLVDLLDRPTDFARELYASLACRAAVMDGDIVPDSAAHEIIRGVLPLQNARCPHGRPVWVEFSREQLFRLVGRT